MSPVRVLCVTPFGPSGRGGIDRLYLYFRDFLKGKTLDGVEVRFARARGGASGNAWMATFPLILIELAWTLARLRPDVVHINFATGGSLPRKYAALRLARLFGARTIVHFHGQFIEDQVAKGTAAGRLFKAIATGADRVVALGDIHAAAFRRIGVPEQHIAIVPNGIPDFAGDVIVPKPQHAKLEILFSGLLTENKGMHLLIAALKQLDERFTDWHCTAAGNGEVAHFAALAKEAGLAQRITFTGWIESATMLDCMRRADIVALPSRTEALPLSLIEGACAGAALIATDVGNVRAIVRDGENGILVARDPDTICAALLRLASDRELLARMQAASRAVYRENFSLAAFAERLRTLYLETAGRR